MDAKPFVHIQLAVFSQQETYYVFLQGRHFSLVSHTGYTNIQMMSTVHSAYVTQENMNNSGTVIEDKLKSRSCITTLYYGWGVLSVQ